MNRKQRLARIAQAMKERVLVLDGAWGVYLQGRGLDEAGYRGQRFADHGRPLKGNHDILCVTQPKVVREIHDEYLAAGADITSTNTFSSTIIAQADYGLQSIIRELNETAAGLAREACDAVEAKDGRPRLVAGALGPTNKTLSLSPDVNDPARRDATFEEMAEAYKDQVLGLISGGADLLLIETIFDTLNAKAALWGAWEAFDATGEELPLWISGTITDRSGRTLSGQTVEAFWNSVRHAKPWAVGFNCALGPAEMRPFLAELARTADCPVSAYPNAGLPNAMGGYDETPCSMEAHFAEWARGGLVNIIGGCCGTTPEHTEHMVIATEGVAPRGIPSTERRLRLSGLEPFTASA
ncbi:MAG: homocysteine S-methyltransferase family protein [Hyphomonadaceae bacterium]|nr:homocysteine S-methyltransferase family protein [Hyphomonadaceae bacterium]